MRNSQWVDLDAYALLPNTKGTCIAEYIFQYFGRFVRVASQYYGIHFLGFFFYPMPHMSFPPGHGRSVTDFSGWDAHEARLRCPDDVSGDIGGCSARRALKPNFN